LAALVLAASLLGLLAGSAGSATAQTDSVTRVLDVGLGGPATTGTQVDLRLDAVNDAAPVNGMVVRFGEREAFGISACQVQDASSGAVPAPFAPGSRVRLAVPHRFSRAGRHRVTMRVDAGGCLAPLPGIFQLLTVTATLPGQPPVPPLIDPPTAVPPPSGVDLPAPLPLPGVDLPPLPPVPGVDLPTPPPVVLPPLPVALPSARQRACPFSRRRAGSSRRSRIAVRCELNKIRQRHRLPTLRGNGRLWQTAGRHSRAMVARSFFSHVAPGGVALADRVQRSGYFTGVRAWTVGENLGYAYGRSNTPRNIVDAWMRSTPHRRNILNAKFRELGLGVVRGVPGNRRRGATFTTVFGRRR